MPYVLASIAHVPLVHALCLSLYALGHAVCLGWYVLEHALCVSLYSTRDASASRVIKRLCTKA